MNSTIIAESLNKIGLKKLENDTTVQITYSKIDEVRF